MAHLGKDAWWGPRTAGGRALLVFALALLPGVAHADSKDDARRHFVAGLEAAKAGQYEVALQRFLAANEAYPHPATLYNIARSYLDLEDYATALVYYRQFREASPDKASQVDPVIAALEVRLRGGDAAPVAGGASSGTGGGGFGATAEEVARLQAIAAELEALTRALGERASEVPTEVPAGEGTPREIDEAVADIEGGGFIDEAYTKVVVTASRYGQEPIDSPSTITVITADDILLSGVTTIPDVLRRVVGVEVMSLASTGFEVSIRGFNRELSNKVLVLIDGRSTYLDFLGTSFWPTFPVTLEEIERIEVIRGPGSAVYGANAVTGVINIITKTPGEDTSLAKVEAGSPGYSRVTGLVSGRTDKNAYRFSTSYQQEGRWAKEFEVGETSPMVPLQQDQDLARRSVQFNGRIDRPFGDDGFASMSGGYNSGTFEFYSIGALGNFWLDDRHHYIRTDISYGVAHLRAFWNHDQMTTGRWAEPVSEKQTFNATGTSDTFDVELEANGTLTTGSVQHRLNGGIGYRYKVLANLEYMGGFDPKEHHVNAFINEEATAGALKLVGSLRVDRHPLLPISETISPRGSAILRVADDTSVRVTGGSAFRAPTLLESYMDVNLGTTVDGVYLADFGSRDLVPERILTVEAGAHDESTLYHTLDVAVYYNRLTDIISLRSVEPEFAFYDPEDNGFLVGSTGWANTDVGYDGVGVETDFELYPADGLDVYANVAITSIVETSDEGRVRDLSTSMAKINGGVMYRTPFRTDITLGAHYVSAQTWRLRDFDAQGQIVVTEADLDPRLILNARLAARPLPEESLEVAASVWNLLGTDEASRFREHPKGQPVGHRVVGTVTYRF